MGKLSLVVIVFFILIKTMAFESAALKANILICHGFFLEKKETVGFKKEYNQLIQTMKVLITYSMFNNLNKEKYISEGKNKAIKSSEPQEIYFIFLGCKQDIRSFQNLVKE
tara:strand:- start:497 stop:829 length:333 start_codon:yes stop_codon:yes gene_type:complete